MDTRPSKTLGVSAGTPTATVLDPLVGRTLDGRYHIQGRIARGGMAAVYYAVDCRLDRAVAVKVMHPRLSEDPNFVGRFIREAKAAAMLSHPNIVAVFDQGIDGGHVYLTMEYVEGRTLREVLREHGPLTPRQALSVMEPMLAALSAAHRAGLVHRDIKPENVLLADDGRVKVADFGLARAVRTAAEHTSERILIGTVAYLSPEQVDRSVTDARSDVYAAGIVLYELLTGERPYAGETSLQIAYQHVNSEVPPPSDLVPTLSPLVDAIVARATQRDPDQRPADAGQFLTELLEVHHRLSEAELDAGGVVRTTTRHDVTPRREGGEPATAVLGAPAGDGHASRATAVMPRAPGHRRATGPTGTRRAPVAKRRRRGGLAMTFLLGAALVVSLFAWWLGGGGHSNVPAVIGMSEADARAAVIEAGLKVQIGERVFSDDVPIGNIADSIPAPGARVARGSDIVLYPSKGPELFAVPNVTGKSVDEATALLEAANFTRGEVTEAYNGRVEPGTVISTDPPPGAERTRGAAVALVVSKGPAPVEVPSVVGEHVTNAKQILNAAGFKVAEQTANSDETPRDFVIAQNPPGGTAASGSTVEITVSLGPRVAEVPDVVGMRVTRAQRELTNAGFTSEVIELTPGSQDRVITQFPLGGSQAKPGTTVRLWTS